MIRKSAVAASIAALLTPAVASALGLGNIQVTSALNEPLKARIPLRGADPGQLEELRVALADDQQFERAGLDRVFVLTKLKFEVVEAGSGSGFINISTRDPVSEPFLNFLVDVNWARGRVLREYTVLLDPPVYGAAISSGTERKVRTVETLPLATPPKPAPKPVMTPKPAAPAPMIVAPTQATPRYTGDSYGPVRRGETLWSIADQVRPAGTSIQSMMLALLRANPEAFSLDNVNALRTGAVLQIPPASEITGGKAAALEEVARQHALWAEYRQSVAGSVSAQPGGAPPAPAAAPAASAGSPAAATATGGTGSGESSAELKLVGAGTTGAATGGGADVEALRNELTMAQEEADAAKLENQELQSRLTEVESLVGDLQRLVELKEDQLAALQDQLAKAGEQAAAQPAPMPGTTESGSTESQASESQTTESQAMEPKPTEPEPKMAAGGAQQTEPPAAAPKAPEPAPAAKKKRRAPPPPPEPKSFMDEINDMLPVPLWTLLAGLGAVLLGFGGWRFARGRKEKATADTAAAAIPGAAAGASMIEQYANTEVPGDATDDDATELPDTTSPPDGTVVEDVGDDLSDMQATARNTAAAPPDEDDPLAEVNVYLAYERFDQAEQLVRDAIASYPDRHDYKLKLLEVFYAAKNLSAFEVAAGELRDAVGDDHDMMQQAREWWADLGAGHELFSQESGPSTSTGAQAPVAAADDDLFDVTASEGEETGVDFDLGFETDDGSGSGGGSSLDFDLSADDTDAAKPDDGNLDFDLGSLGGAATVAGGAAVAGAAAAAASDLDFDLGAGDDAKDGEGSATGAADDLDFNLDAGDEAGDATGVDFDLTEPAGLDSPVSPDAVTEQPSLVERAADVDSDSDTGVDFDLGGLDDDAASAAGSATGADAGDSSLDFDLGDTAGTVDGGQAHGAGTLHDEAGEESGLEFDLGDTQNAGSVAASVTEEAAGAVDPDSELDFDLGDTGAGSAAAGDEESALDFDLGDTGPGVGGGDATPADEDGALDFDLGDTHQSVTAPGETVGGGTGTGADAELDFDLSDTHQSVTAPGETIGGGTGTGDDAELDFDLGDTHQSVTASGETVGGGTGTGADAELDFDLGDTQEADAGIASIDPDAELDFDLGDTAGSLGSETAGGVEDLGLDLDLGAATSDTGDGALSLDDVGGGQELDLSLDAGDDDAAARTDLDPSTGVGGDDSLPVIDMDGEESPAFDTVQLDPDAADSIRDNAGGGSEFGVDTEFRGIFSSGEEGDSDAAAAGSESVLDFDLGSADLGAGAEAEDTGSTGFSELESTQFMLNDIGEDEGGEDEDDHTLVLGRGASGEVDEIQTKLDLAQAYMDMGDTEGARNLLGEVMADGDDPQKEQAGEMLKKLS